MEIRFSLFKNDRKASEKQPDYAISMKIDDSFRNVGAGWIKEGQKGQYISCTLDTEKKEYKKDKI